jgi:hypothetical protein
MIKLKNAREAERIAANGALTRRTGALAIVFQPRSETVAGNLGRLRTSLAALCSIWTLASGVVRRLVAGRNLRIALAGNNFASGTRRSPKAVRRAIFGKVGKLKRYRIIDLSVLSYKLNIWKVMRRSLIMMGNNSRVASHIRIYFPLRALNRRPMTERIQRNHLPFGDDRPTSRVIAERSTAHGHRRAAAGWQMRSAKAARGHRWRVRLAQVWIQIEPDAPPYPPPPLFSIGSRATSSVHRRSAQKEWGQKRVRTHKATLPGGFPANTDIGERNGSSNHGCIRIRL